MHLAHFQALLLCAALISIGFASLSRRGIKERFASALRYFLLLVFISILLGWIMYPFSH